MTSKMTYVDVVVPIRSRVILDLESHDSKKRSKAASSTGNRDYRQDPGGNQTS